MTYSDDFNVVHKGKRLKKVPVKEIIYFFQWFTSDWIKCITYEID